MRGMILINKKIIVIFSIILVVLIVLGLYFVLTNNSENNQTNESNNNQNNNEQNSNQDDGQDINVPSSGGDSATGESVVIYFSATGNTERVAGYIQEITGSDIIEIIPADEYTNADLNYSDDDCRANQEQNDDSARPEIANEIDVDSYDTIYLGFPIWWGDVPKIILTFLDTYDLSGKTVIPFCTSGGSGISTSMNTLRNYNQNINWIDGEQFSSGASKNAIESWINSLD